MAVLLGGGDFDFAGAPEGFEAVEDEVGDDFLELIGIGEDGRNGGELGADGGARLFESGEGAPDAVVQVGGGAFELELLAEEGEARDEVLDMIDAAADGAEGVFAEFGIIEVFGEVLEGEVEGGGGVFKVVDEESGDGLESFHLLGLEKAGGEFEVKEVGSKLISDTFEEFEFLQFQGDVIDAVAEGAKADKPAGGVEWDANAVAGVREIIGETCPEMQRPLGGRLVDVERGVGVLESGDEFISDVSRKLLAGGGETGGGGEVDGFGVGLDQPNGGGENAELFRDPSGDSVAEGVAVVNVRGFLREAKPDGAVIEERAMEMAADPAAEPVSRTFGDEKDREQREGREEDESFECEGVRPLPGGEEFVEDADEEQVGADEDTGDRKLEDLLGRIDFHAKEAGAEQSDEEEQRSEKEGGAGNDVERKRVSAEQEDLGRCVKIRHEVGGGAENDVFDAPAHGADGGAEGSFQMDKDQGGGDGFAEVDEKSA